MGSAVDPDRFAALLCDWCLEVRPGHQVLVATTPLADDLNRALHRALLERGAWPLLRIAPPWAAADFYRHAPDSVLDSHAEVERAEAEGVRARVRIDAPEDLAALSGIDPARIARSSRAQRPVREAVLAGRWCSTIWPTLALAQQAGMDEEDYAAFLARALFLDREDPVAAWQELSHQQAQLVARLSTVQGIRVEAEDTDLRLRVGGRRWINSDGRRNMPSGEVFTGPLETSAEGRIRFTIPSAPRGVQVEDVRLEFHHGEVVSATAARGQDYLEAALATDPGARYVGELGIGTNFGIDRPTGSILLDEKMGGTVHLALGRSYPETGATNSSALHWDLVCDLRRGGRITADGEELVLASQAIG